MSDILQCLRKYGERLDSEIAHETGVPLESVRQLLASVAAAGDVVMCTVTRFENGNRTDARLYRVSGYIPPAAPGRKAAPKTSPGSTGRDLR